MFNTSWGSGSATDTSDDDASIGEPEKPATPMELLRDENHSVTGEAYHEEFLTEEYVDDEAVLSIVKDTSPSDSETDFVAGPWARELIETHALSDDEPIWLGYMTQNQRLVEIGLKLTHLARHMWIPGTSGAGKSTLFEVLQMQMAYKGNGFVTFDPKGVDSRELVAKLPEHRLDDLIVVDPVDPEQLKTIALNFLEIPEYIVEDGERATEREIASRKDNIRAFFEGDQWWGPNMEFITSVLGEGMMRANVNLLRRGGDPSKQYTFIDFFTMVLNATTRENFAEEISDPFLRSAVERVSSMDDDETLPTLKRIIPWVLNRITRKIIAHRESSIDFREIIEEDKIVVVRTAIDNEDIRQMLTLGVMRMLWSAVQRRAQTTDGTPKPFFIFADEFDDIASEQLDMDRMLTKARSMNLGVIIANQFPSQIKDDYPDTYKAITNNAQTLTAFRSLEKPDASEVMGRFPGYDADDLLDTDDYEIWSKIALGGGATSEPLKLDTFAPYPKLRPMDEVDGIIADRLDETGVEPLTTAEIIQQMPYDDPYGLMGAATSGEIRTAEGALHQKREGVEREVCRAIYHEGIFRGETTGGEDDDWWIPVDRALKERADRYVYGGIDTEETLDQQLTEMAGTHIEKRQNDGREVTLTDSGRAQLFVAGKNQTAGRGDHLDLGEDSIIALLRLGLEADVVEQTGGRDVDGIVRIRELRETGVPEGVTPGAIGRLERKRYERMVDDYPLLTWLTDGADCTVEFEKSTAGRKSLINWAKAYNAGEVCLFTARESEADRVWNALADPLAVKAIDKETETVQYYNHTRKITIGGESVVIENASNARWSYDERDEEYVLSDEEGVIRARFDTHHEIISNKSQYDGVEDDYDDVELGDDGPHLTVNMPIIPERLFDIESRDELDPERDARVLVIPENIGADDRPIEEIINVVSNGTICPLADAFVSRDTRGPGNESEPEELWDTWDPLGDDTGSSGDEVDIDDFDSLFVDE